MRSSSLTRQSAAIKPAGASIEHPKRRGEWAELQFMARAAEHGLLVSKPWGDSARYDFAVESNGRFLRIQVKSTIARFQGGYMCGLQLSGHREPYTAKQVDFFAAYVIPEDVWYILPVEVAARVSRITLAPGRKEQKWERYKEAWHLLRDRRGRRREESGSEGEVGLRRAGMEESGLAADPSASENAEPEDIPEMRGTVEPAPAPGFDADLLRQRLASGFDRMRNRR
jgi:hypothetical protein